jgi:hypothetical protein
MVARSNPVMLRSDHESRYLQVIGEEMVPRPFDEHDQIQPLVGQPFVLVASVEVESNPTKD